MSFLKKLGHKFGARPQDRANARQDGSQRTPDSSRGTSPRVSSSTLVRDNEGTSIAGLDKKLKGSTRIVETRKGEFQDRGDELSGPTSISISGGVFNNAGRDVVNISETHIENQYVVNEETNESKLYAMLNPIPAAHDSQEVTSKVSECFANTRHQLLLDLKQWRTNDSVPTFILDGIAGIGKTTVVKTVCTQAAAEGCLAASWFFSRDQQDRKTTRGFVATLAFQLASYHPILRDRISQALKDNPDILQKAIRIQFDKLIHQPLQYMFERQGGTHVISIDAIDECDLNEATEILSILLSTMSNHSQLRLLITCRPERPFRLLLQKYRGSHVFHLHDIENSVVESDIRLYIYHYLSPEQVDEALPDLLPPAWRASAQEKEAVVQMAGKLFIVASTAVNFILDPTRLDPERQMRLLLDANKGKGLAASPMDRLYTQVLRAAVPEPIENWFEDYQSVVGAIVVALDVLSVPSLAVLLGLNPNSIIRTLSHLHSLIAPTKNTEAFRIHHKSFPDFVTDESRCSIDSRFFIDSSAQHFRLACCCLRVMTRMLKQNICDLPPSDWDKALEQISPDTVGRIHPELAYACAHWVSHFDKGKLHFTSSSDMDDIINQLRTFVDTHLLSWLEVLAWTGRFDTAWDNASLLSGIISQAASTLPEATPGTLAHMVSVLQDCLRFVNLFPGVPHSSPMQIYLSLVPFLPAETQMRKLYAQNMKGPVAVVSGLEPFWSPSIFTLQSNPQNLVFSPCDSMIVTSSEHVRLYNAKSGAQLRQFSSENTGGLLWGSALAFSADGRYIAAGRHIKAEQRSEVQVWDVATGESMLELTLPPGKPRIDIPNLPYYRLPTLEFWKRLNSTGPMSIAFNHDGTALLVGTHDGTVVVEDMEGEASLVVFHTDNGRSGPPCECPPSQLLPNCWAHQVENLIPYPNSSQTAVVTPHALQVWELDPPRLLHSIPRYVEGDHSSSVAFSLDRSMVAVTSTAETITIYTPSMDSYITTLSGYQGFVTAMAFGSKSQDLCAASNDYCVHIWDIATSSLTAVIPIIDTLTHAIFSPCVDGFIITYSSGMIRLDRGASTLFGSDIPFAMPNVGMYFSSDGSTVAINDSFTTSIFPVKDLTEAYGNRIQPLAIGYFPTGELVLARYFDDSSIHVTIGSQSKGNTHSFILEGQQYITLSPNSTRLAVMHQFGVLVYNLRSENKEAILEPPPSLWGGSRPRVWFSQDSDAAYVLVQDTLYMAGLPHFGSSEPSPSSTPGICAPFQRYTEVPVPVGPHWHTRGSPLTPDMYALVSGSAWVYQNGETAWTSVDIPNFTLEPSRSSRFPKSIRFSPHGPVVAMSVALTTGEGKTGEGDDDVDVIQLRNLPDFNVVATFSSSRDMLSCSIHFLDSDPDILAAHSPREVSSWSILSMASLGRYHISESFLFISDIHLYSGTDILCLVHTSSQMFGLRAVKIKGHLPAVVRHICWFPLHLRIIFHPTLYVNPRHPHVVALKAESTVIEIDISKCALPFDL